ncbi:MAG: hypothetical protein U0Z74_01770 [Romboutsia timonensis]
MYVAALANVSPELVDAAMIDGANIFQRIRHIDIPTLKPLIILSYISGRRNNEYRI